MIRSPTAPITITALLKLPETQPASELIDGRIIQKPLSQGKHRTIQGKLVPAINAALKPE